MTPVEEQFQDADIAQLAVQALNAASRRACMAGHTLVFVRDGKLIRRSKSGDEILRAAPKPLKVPTRIKIAKP